MQRWADTLAQWAPPCRADIVCGPRTGGAFLAQCVASTLGAEFAYAERIAVPGTPVRYRIPDPLRAAVAGKRVLLVDDAVNAGSALLATLADAATCGATIVGCASLIALGDAATHIARDTGVPFHSLLSLDRQIWSAEACPLCAAGVALDN